MTENWTSYDGIAEAYDQIAAPHYFQAPARRLVSLLRLSTGDRVLDVGTGTGVVASAVIETVGDSAMVVGTDLSVAMLLAARRRGISRAVAGGLPSLPYTDETFDGVAAGFVLHHILGYEEALGEMVRVLRRGGRLGVTTWAVSPSGNAMGQVWDEICVEFAEGENLSEAVESALPWGERFSDIRALEKAVEAAGLYPIDSEQSDLPVTIRTADYVESRGSTMSARFLRRRLEPKQWQRFRETVLERIVSRFGGRLEFTTRVNLVVGQKPGFQ